MIIFTTNDQCQKKRNRGFQEKGVGFGRDKSVIDAFGFLEKQTERVQVMRFWLDSETSSDRATQKIFSTGVTVGHIVAHVDHAT